MVGAEYDTQHGLTNAIVLSAVLRDNAPAMRDKVAVRAQVMGLGDTSFEAFYTYICALLDQLGIPKTLVEIGVAPDCAPRIAGKALEDSAVGTNLRTLTLCDLEQVVAKALSSGRFGWRDSPLGMI